MNVLPGNSAERTATPAPRGRSLALTLVLLCMVALSLYQVLPRYYELNLSPLQRPDDRPGTREARAALQAPLDMVRRLLGEAPEERRRRLVAMTFDDGPYPMYTPVLLDVLRHYQVRATFFVNGVRVREFPELARAIAADGHELANHTDEHKRGRELGPERFPADVLRCEDSLAAALGIRPHLFRPAGGSLEPELMSQVLGLGYTVVGDTVNPGDWYVQDSEKLLEGSFRGRNREGVMLFHNGSMHTVSMLPSVITELRSKGFRFVTVSQLAEATGQPLPLNPRLKDVERARTLESSGISR